MPVSFRSLSFVLLGLILPALARADIVLLRNGDRVSGQVLAKSGDILRVKTPYAGVVKIKWEAVQSLSTDSPVEVLVAGAKAPVRARIRQEAPNLQGVVVGDEHIALAKLSYINPKPEESGIGLSYHGHVNVSAANTTGNNTSDHIYADAGFTARAKRYRYGLSGEVNRSSDSGQLSASNWLVSGHYDRYLEDDHFVYGRGSLQHDQFKDIRLRRTVGGGFGADLIETAHMGLTLRGGVDQVNVEHLGSPNESYAALGWGVHATYRFGGKGPELFHDQDGFWNLQNRSHVTILSRTGLRVPLSDNLSASVQLNVDWDRKPVPGTKPTDSTLLLGGAYSW